MSKKYLHQKYKRSAMKNEIRSRLSSDFVRSVVKEAQKTIVRRFGDYSINSKAKGIAEKPPSHVELDHSYSFPRPEEIFTLSLFAEMTKHFHGRLETEISDQSSSPQLPPSEKTTQVKLQSELVNKSSELTMDQSESIDMSQNNTSETADPVDSSNLVFEEKGQQVNPSLKPQNLDSPEPELDHLSSAPDPIPTQDSTENHNPDPSPNKALSASSPEIYSTQQLEPLHPETGEENPLRISPLKIPMPSSVQKSKPFIKHPLSLGFDFQMVNSAYYWKREQKKIHKENMKRRPPSPLSKYIIKKPFFPDFIDPIPLNYEPKPKRLPYLQPKLIQIDKISSSNMRTSTESSSSSDVEHTPNGIVSPLTRDQEHMLLAFFNDLCHSLVASKPSQCMFGDRCRMNHELPDEHYVERQLLKNFLKEAESSYKFFLLFPSALRHRFFPAFVRYFVARNSKKMLAKLVKDCQKIPPYNDFELIIKTMVSQSWTRCDALKFVIKNHKDSPDSRQTLVQLIGSTGKDVSKFIDYLQQI